MHPATNANGTVSLTIMVRPEPPGQHTAQVVGLPEFRATAATAEAAVGEVQQKLNESLAAAQWLQVALPASAPEPRQYSSTTARSWVWNASCHGRSTPAP